MRDLDIEFIEEEEKPYENKKGINFFGLVRAMKKKATESIINAQVKVVKSKLRKVDTFNSIITLSVLVLYPARSASLPRLGSLYHRVRALQQER